MTLKYHTPYLLKPDDYLELFEGRFDLDKEYFKEFLKYHPVYITDIRDGDFQLAIYNDDLTEELNSFAWVRDPDILMPYTEKARQAYKKELLKQMKEDMFWSSL